MSAAAARSVESADWGRPEGQFASCFPLLQACCADLPDDARGQRIGEVLRAGLDWERFPALVQRCGVAPRVLRSLQMAACPAPLRVLDALRWLDRSNAQLTLRLTAELVRVLAHLKSRGIAAVPYKGPVLAQALYGDVTRRQFGDLDLFLRREDVPRAVEAVQEIGYRPHLTLTSRQEQAYLQSGYEYAFDGSHNNLLELKWNVLPDFFAVDFDLEGMFRRCVTMSLGGQTVSSFCPEDTLLILCVHAAKHGWAKLSWLYDIAQLARTPGLGWETVDREAKRMGVQRILAVTFLLANRLLETPLPSTVVAYLRVDSEAAAFCGRILPRVEHTAEPDIESASYFRLMMSLRERRRDRARFLWRLAFTPGPGEWESVHLPDFVFPLYRLVRLWRLQRRMFSSSLPRGAN